MNAKDKALELVDKYYSYKWYNGKKICSMTKEAAKQCAIICVSELMTSYEKWREFEYWHDVKTEIENL